MLNAPSPPTRKIAIVRLAKRLSERTVFPESLLRLYNFQRHPSNLLEEWPEESCHQLPAAPLARPRVDNQEQAAGPCLCFATRETP